MTMARSTKYLQEHGITSATIPVKYDKAVTVPMPGLDKQRELLEAGYEIFLIPRLEDNAITIRYGRAKLPGRLRRFFCGPQP